MSRDQSTDGIGVVGVFCGVCHRCNDGASDFCACRESLIGYRPLNKTLVASWVTGQLRERDAARVRTNADDIDVLRTWAGRGQRLHRMRRSGVGQSKPMFTFFTVVKRSAGVAAIALIVGLPGCAQLNVGFGPAAASGPNPGWVMTLSLVAVLAFEGLIILVPILVVTQIAIYVRFGAGATERSGEGTMRNVYVADQAATQHAPRAREQREATIWRGALVGALVVLLVGIGLSVDTDSSEWVIPDPQSGWIGVPLVVGSIGILAVLFWWRWRTDTRSSSESGVSWEDADRRAGPRSREVKDKAVGQFDDQAPIHAVPEVPTGRARHVTWLRVSMYGVLTFAVSMFVGIGSLIAMGVVGITTSDGVFWQPLLGVVRAFMLVGSVGLVAVSVGFLGWLFTAPTWRSRLAAMSALLGLALFSLFVFGMATGNN